MIEGSPEAASQRLCEILAARGLADEIRAARKRGVRGVGRGRF